MLLQAENWQHPGFFDHIGVPAMDAMPVAGTPRRVQFSFTGSAAEYFRIWIANVLLSIVTLGVYSAWAKVRTRRYFFGNTVVDGHRFDYLADPVRILKGRLIAVGALAVYLFTWYFYPNAGLYALTAMLLLLPAMLVMAAGFQLRNTAYRNLRFGFRGTLAGAYRLLLVPLAIVVALAWTGYALWESSEMAMALENVEGGEFHRSDMIPTIFVLALAPLLPYLDYLRTRFTADHAAYGSLPMRLGAGAGGFYKVYLLTMALSFAVVFLFVLVLSLSGLVAGMLLAVFGGLDVDTVSSYFSLLSMVLVYAVLFFVMGYMKARKTNLIYNSLALGETRIHSRLGARDIGWIYLGNTLAIIASLGMLIPWAKVRMARYAASRTELAPVDLEQATAGTGTERTAIGEELGDAFGFDFGV
jgi:uncharacterized membrane protein YjgN (DUF898 family)